MCTLHVALKMPMFSTSNNNSINGDRCYLDSSSSYFSTSSFDGSSHSSSDGQNRMAMADPAFRAIPKNSTCFIIWRIEKMQLIPVPKDLYGHFYTGDSYVVLSIIEVGDSGGTNIKVKEAKRALDIHIHFWLGKNTSQDEAGVAAYKTVEMDDYLGGSPVQHREVQGHESKRFLAYFKSGIRLLEGGVASGFNHVVDTFTPQMYLIKGKRRPILKQLPNISWEYMNDGDVFVIDTKQVIMVWSGRFANKMEKLQGAQTAQKLKEEYGTSNILFVDDGKEANLPKDEKEFFNQYLQLKGKSVQSHTEVESDTNTERRQSRDLKLYRCSDEDGMLKVTEIKSGPLHQQDLNSQDSFIVDNGDAGIWVWVGRKASQKERMESMRNAQGFIKKKGYPNHTQVTRVIDGGETMEFKALFMGWKERNQTMGVGRAHSQGFIAKTIQTKFDAATLHENSKLAAQTQMVDDGSGKKQVWRVENFNLTTVNTNQHGIFFGGDCYVVVYMYHNGSSENCIIYYWLGRKSTADERGTAALKAVELDDSMGGKAVQVRVVQGKEPPHFMVIFGGSMIIFEGGNASGFHNVDQQNTGPGDEYLLQVHGTSSMNTKAVQVEKRAASLNSNDVFVLFTKAAVFIWAGKGSTGDEREMAKNVASSSKRDPILVSEGQEKNDFWDAVGGKEPYSNDKRLQESNDSHLARLFQCSNASGKFIISEIFDFDQSDLVEEDVMLLDAWDVMFIWVGNDSNNEERQRAENSAQEYLRTDPSGRDVQTPIVRIKQGFEPPNFTGFFGVWDRSLWNNNKSYEQIKKEIQEENPGMNLVSPMVNGTPNYANIPRFPLEVLLNKDPEKFPAEIDPACKELYLSDEEFELVFQMKHLDFESLPQWKQISLKKKSGLF